MSALTVPAPPGDQQESEAFQRFYDSLFRTPAGRMEEDYQSICRTWQQYTDACSVFLWLAQNGPGGRTWYLVAFEGKPGLHLPPPKALWHNGSDKRSIVEYCALTKAALFIETPAVWSADPPEGCEGRGGPFQTQIGDYFKEINCQSLITIPLIRARELPTGDPTPVPPPGQAAETPEQEVVGAICLHYTRPFKIIGRPWEDDAIATFSPVGETVLPPTPPKRRLELLGRLTAQELLRSREALQKRTLLKLNELAGRWLVASSRTPEIARQEYLKALQDLIHDVFKVDSLAIFYREAPACDAAVLLHSTGIVEHGDTPRLIPPAEWGTVRYTLDEGQTGRCFAKAELIPLPEGLVEVPDRFPKTYEVAARLEGSGGEEKWVWTPKHWSDPALILPIPLPPSEEPRASKGHALGVIRFASHRWWNSPGLFRAFDPVEIETIQFLAQQIGPVLETMARNIEVEKAIAEQRHELRNSVRVINELIDEMTEDIGNAAPEAVKQVKAYDLWDLKYSGLLARAQVQRLYRDETENRDLNTAATEIYGQIIQRVCLIVGRRTARQKNMRINCSISATIIKDGAPQRLHVDPWYIEQAFLNLLMNAVKYGNGGSPIDVIFTETMERTVVSVRNTGVGIEETEREMIFESGYRAAKAIARATGAGLGLPITRVIMRKHGGDATLEKLHTPTIFQLTLPGVLRSGPPPPKTTSSTHPSHG